MSALTLDEIAQLRALGPTRYRQQVISLFASGQATEAQWQALARACQAFVGRSRTHYDVQPLLTALRDLCARQHEWHAMADIVLTCSESDTGDLVVAIDRAVLAHHRACSTHAAAHAVGRDAWGR